MRRGVQLVALCPCMGYEVAMFYFSVGGVCGCGHLPTEHAEGTGPCLATVEAGEGGEDDGEEEARA